MALRILSFLFFISFNIAWAGNGSSGVGTASIAKGIHANNMGGMVERIGDEIIDLSSKEKIINVVTINKDEIDFTKLAKAQFGQVSGFEYVPSSMKEKNYWIVCKKGEKTCSKFIPTSNTNNKIISILGSLVEDKGE
jgi:hypothetical protein